MYTRWVQGAYYTNTFLAVNNNGRITTDFTNWTTIVDNNLSAGDWIIGGNGKFIHGIDAARIAVSTDSLTFNVTTVGTSNMGTLGAVYNKKVNINDSLNLIDWGKI